MLKRKFLKVFSIVTILVVIFSFMLSVPGSAISEMLTIINYDYTDHFYTYLLPFQKSKLTVDGNKILFPNVNAYAALEAFDSEYNSNWYDRYSFVLSNAIVDGVADIAGSYYSVNKHVVYSQSFGRRLNANSVDYLTCVDSFHVYYDVLDYSLTDIDSDYLSFDFEDGFSSFSVYGGSVRIPVDNNYESLSYYKLWFAPSARASMFSCVASISYDYYQFDTVYDSSSDQYVTKLTYVGTVEDYSVPINDGQYVPFFNLNSMYSVDDPIYSVDLSKDIYIDNVEIDVETTVVGDSLPVNSGVSGYWAAFQVLTPVTLEGVSIEDAFAGGYDAFLNEPIGSGDAIKVDFENISFTSWAINIVNTVMSLQIVPDVTVGVILWFCVGLGLFFFLMKTFLGG